MQGLSRHDSRRLPTTTQPRARAVRASLQNACRMGTRGTGFSVLGSFVSRSTFLAGTGCIDVLGCWEDGKGEDAVLKSEMSPSDLLLPD